MNNELELRFDPPNPGDARGKSWEPIEIYIEPGSFNIASWFWENPALTDPIIVNWARNAPEDQRALVRAKIAEFAKCTIKDIVNLDSTR